jgi:hypothetical protein
LRTPPISPAATGLIYVKGIGQTENAMTRRQGVEMRKFLKSTPLSGFHWSAAIRAAAMQSAEIERGRAAGSNDEEAA